MVYAVFHLCTHSWSWHSCPEIGTSSIDWGQQSRFYLKTPHKQKTSLLTSSSDFCLWLSLSLMLRLTVSRPVCLGIKHSPGAKARSLLLSDSCGFVDMVRSLWREDGSVGVTVNSNKSVFSTQIVHTDNRFITARAQQGTLPPTIHLFSCVSVAAVTWFVYNAIS
jgi:hypothetical protein